MHSYEVFLRYFTILFKNRVVLYNAIARTTGTCSLLFLFAGCASYQPVALSTHPDLAPRISDLRLTLPTPERKSVTQARKVRPDHPITPDQIGLVTMINNPDLVSQRSKIAEANAAFLTARLLPNPSFGASYAFLVSGPATAGAVGASLAADIRSIVTYRPRVDAAKARRGQVGADVLWQEWQVAQKARLLAVGIYYDDRVIGLRKRQIALLAKELKDILAATAAGNLDLTAEAPLEAARAVAEHDLATAELARLKDWQDLNALMGLEPSARFKIAPPRPVRVPSNINGLVATVATRRPDLVALRLGYNASEADVREAILGQFPVFNLGLSAGSDTARVVSLGPQVTMDLPVFDRNQGKIASAKATRAQLRADYQARLDTAEGTARSLVERSRTIAGILARARAASKTASSILASALKAYANGNISQRDLADFETTAIERKLDVLGYERALKESDLGISVELGVGFPNVTTTNAAEGMHL